jgi:PA domain
VFKENSPVAHTYVLAGEWNPGQSTGTTTAALQPAGGIIIPPTPTPTPTSSSTSGCTSSDFTGFTAGRIALIQRGGCNFGVKVLNAQAVGATASSSSTRGTRAAPT